MRTSLKFLCNSFIESRDTIKETFFWGSSYIYPVAAAVFVDKRVTADGERLEMCGDILKENTGFFSNFRNYVKLPMVSMMAVSSDPEDKLKKALSKERAKNCARNETNKAVESLNYDDAVSKGLKKKQWVTILDGKERSSHRKASGQTVGINEPFSIGGYKMMHPMDDSLGAPLTEILGCRCSVRYLR